MKPSVLREMKIDELTEKLAEEKVNLQRFKMNHAVSPLENPLLLRATRKSVARLQTELRRRQLQDKN